MQIVKPNDAILVSNLNILLYGQPGVGKTSLAFSAKNPLLLDFDLGAQRALKRKDVVRVNQWTDVADISDTLVKGYDTIIIDTAGKLLDVMSSHILKTNPKLENRSNGGLSLQGFGMLATMFKNFMLKLKSFNKDVILLCHEVEEKKDDLIVARIKATGKNKDLLFEVADLLGYMFLDGKKRILDFNPTETHSGKNCAEFPEMDIPHLNDHPFFLSDLIQQAKDKMNTKSEEMIKAEKEYNDMLDHINSLTTLDECNKMLLMLKEGGNPAHKKALVTRATVLTFVINAEKTQFEILPAKTDKEVETEAKDTKSKDKAKTENNETAKD